MLHIYTPSLSSMEGHSVFPHSVRSKRIDTRARREGRVIKSHIGAPRCLLEVGFVGWAGRVLILKVSWRTSVSAHMGMVSRGLRVFGWMLMCKLIRADAC